MEYEFEGKTEKEAIDRAIDELGLERDYFDVELLDSSNDGLFNLQKKVRIKIHVPDEDGQRMNSVQYFNPNPQPESDFERGIAKFLENMLSAMGYNADISIMYREDKKIAFRVDSDYSAILIGKKGRNLDAIQLLANVFASRLGEQNTKIVIDIENYRGRREDSLIRLAHKVGDQVMRSKSSQLLGPMNAFERRLIHSALSEIDNIETMSEGEGYIKQVRVIYKGL